MEIELDRISNLSNDIIEHILSYLPIRDATRTSVLSSKWRFQWATLPFLKFDHWCVSTNQKLTPYVKKGTTSFVNVVNHVLLLHIGPIQTFKLISSRIRYRISDQTRLAHSDIDRWILHLSRNSIKEFILDSRSLVVPYAVSSCLFSCQDLIRLKLCNCLLKPPSTFKGFMSLKSLNMRDVTLAQYVFENMIVFSPLLESLTLRNVDGFTNLKIDALHLQFLKVVGAFEIVNLENTLNLADITMELDIHGDLNQVSDRHGHLLKFFAHLPHIQRLTIAGRFLKYLAVGALAGRLPKPCLYLTFLHINICFDDMKEILTALCLLRSSLALQELQISVSFISPLEADDDDDDAEEVKSLSYDNQVCKFTQLRRLKVTDFSCVKAEVDLIKFLLLSSPTLQELEVSFYVKDGDLKLDDNQNCSFSQLRILKVTKISGAKAEIDFIKLVLLSSPVLERIIIEHDSRYFSWKFMKMLVEYNVSDAKINCLDLNSDSHSDEDSSVDSDEDSSLDSDEDFSVDSDEEY